MMTVTDLDSAAPEDLAEISSVTLARTAFVLTSELVRRAIADGGGAQLRPALAAQRHLDTCRALATRNSQT